MSTQIIPVATKTAKPVVAGIFNIVVGSFCVLGALVMAIFGLIFMPWAIDPWAGDAGIAGIVLVLGAIPLMVLGVISLVGGVYGVQRRKWGWAIAGSIASALTSTALGVASIILVAISKDEFSA